MNIPVKPEVVPTNFDINEKLKRTGAHWSYLKLAPPNQDCFNYEFITSLIDEAEYAIYVRVDNYFVLVDFFKNYEEACCEAKEIIDNNQKIKSAINSPLN